MRRRQSLGALLLAAGWPGMARARTGTGTGTGTQAGFSVSDDDAPVRRGRALRFPRDHGAHLGAAIEWWYITGVLSGPQAEPFGFQITFFRSRTGLAEELDSRFAARHVMFAHAALTDLRARIHLHTQRVARWSGDESSALARASTRDTDLLVGGWSLLRSDAGAGSLYVARFGTSGGVAAHDFWLDLELGATQPVLLQGEAGFSRKGPDEAQASHYLSEPQLSVRGTLKRGGKGVAVTGKAWLDHEWSEQLMHPDAVGWDWIGMNLDNGGALTAFRLRRTDGSSLWAGGSFRAPGGTLQVFGADSVTFAPLREWQSPTSAARYPLHWKIETPVGRFEVRALLDTQELDSRASTGTVYWEGLSELLDTQQRRVGTGYLEMTGYAGRLRLGG